LPANLALAQLVERADSGLRSRLFIDDVHLSPLGSSYIALFAAMSMFGPTQSAPPAAGDADTRLLQEQARNFLGTPPPAATLTREGCRRYLRESFLDDYWSFVRTGSAWQRWRMKRASTAVLLRTESP
jgi:hypothetical protein